MHWLVVAIDVAGIVGAMASLVALATLALRTWPEARIVAQVSFWISEAMNSGALAVVTALPSGLAWWVAHRKVRAAAGRS